MKIPSSKYESFAIVKCVNPFIFIRLSYLQQREILNARIVNNLLVDLAIDEIQIWNVSLLHDVIKDVIFWEIIIIVSRTDVNIWSSKIDWGRKCQTT